MKPILFEIFGVPFASWYVFYALAALCAYAYFYFLISSYKNITYKNFAPQLFIACYVGGWVGARALSIVVEQFDVNTIGQFFVELFNLGPMTFYGGALGAFLFGFTLLKIYKFPVSPFADTAFCGGAIGLGVGRIGCHLNGDDYGLPVPEQFSDSFWAVTFPSLHDGIARYPVQLEEAIFAICAGVVCGIALKKSSYLKFERPGLIACTVILLTSINRFVNEFFRGDVRGYFLNTPLSTSQGIALILIAFCLVYSTFFAKRVKSAA